MSNCLLLITPEDKEYLPHVKSMFGGKTTYVISEPIVTLAQLEAYCVKRNITSIVSTSRHALAKCLEREGKSVSNPSLGDYAGSVFSLKRSSGPETDWSGCEIVFISPLAQLFTVPHGKFIASRFISKVVNPTSWPESTRFSWELAEAGNIESYYESFKHALAIACDIETFKQNLAIRCIGYTAIFVDSTSGSITTRSIVLPLDSLWALAWMRKFNKLPVDKIFQNGKYDNSYLLRYNASPSNWFWDTANGMHSWYAELPKDLAFLNAFFLRKVVYWKDLAETSDLYEYYKYNALDTWATANVWIQQMLQSPPWAKRNYCLEFPLVYPSILAEMTGLPRDAERIKSTREELEKKEAAELDSLRKCINTPNFNPGSPPQTVKLLEILGNKDIKSSGEILLKKAMIRHPLNALIFGKILNIRGWRKLCNTYLRMDKDANPKTGEGGAKEYKGYWLYTINPHGTDTGRNSSGEHHFWCGANIQNAPTRDGPEIKQTVCSPEGFYIAEVDLEQAESRDTAHIAGDENLIKAVSGTRDFHSINASSFFGVPYDSIYDDGAKRTKDKKLRDLAKRVNHGANYNMGPNVLVDTMGIDKIMEARRLLKLLIVDPKEVAKYLLERFHKTYPNIAGKYYVAIVNEVGISNKIVSRAFHHTEYNLRTYKAEQYIKEGDWTRYCFGDPKNKSALNAYVAHAPQSLNARTLNEGFMRVFYELALPNPGTFRLHAQIHDSILCSYKAGHEHLVKKMAEYMEIPVTVRDVSGTSRTFTVPASIKMGKPGMPVKYWSETE